MIDSALQVFAFRRFLEPPFLRASAFEKSGVREDRNYSVPLLLSDISGIRTSKKIVHVFSSDALRAKLLSVMPHMVFYKR
jgi:hypothetical protein